MTNLEQIKNKVEEVRGTEKGNKLVSFMLEKGYDLDSWAELDNADVETLETIVSFFGEELAIGDSLGKTGTEGTEGGDLSPDEIKEIKKQNKKNGKGKGKTAEGTETKGMKLKKYKTIDNIITLTDAKETIIGDVDELNEKMFATYMQGTKLAKLWLNGNLVFDPTMQRGIKEDKTGVERAVFREGHIKDIADSMKDNSFTPTQIHLAIIVDDEDLEFEYDEDNKELAVHGKIRLLDGQHRTRALAKIFNEIDTGRMEDIYLDKYVFNVLIHVVTAEEARVIYSNIDKNLKLDKSQARQLQSDAYAKIVNYLNQNSESDLKGKIAVTRPVGRRLVLFSTLTQALEDNVKIDGVLEREEIKKYVADFFNYVAYKLPKAFGNDENARMEFKKNNLLNENNFFHSWIAIAFADKDNFKENIDKVVENVNYFNKDNPVWLRYNAVKHKVGKEEGFAMNNTNTGIKAMVNETLKMLGYKEEEGDGGNAE